MSIWFPNAVPCLGFFVQFLILPTTLLRYLFSFILQAFSRQLCSAQRLNLVTHFVNFYHKIFLYYDAYHINALLLLCCIIPLKCRNGEYFRRHKIWKYPNDNVLRVFLIVLIYTLSVFLICKDQRKTNFVRCPWYTTKEIYVTTFIRLHIYQVNLSRRVHFATYQTYVLQYNAMFQRFLFLFSDNVQIILNT